MAIGPAKAKKQKIPYVGIFILNQLSGLSYFGSSLEAASANTHAVHSLEVHFLAAQCLDVRVTAGGRFLRTLVARDANAGHKNIAKRRE